MKQLQTDMQMQLKNNLQHLENTVEEQLNNCVKEYCSNAGELTKSVNQLQTTVDDVALKIINAQAIVQTYSGSTSINVSCVRPYLWSVHRNGYCSDRELPLILSMAVMLLSISASSKVRCLYANTDPV